MPKILKKNTAILQVPEKVINDKNKLINSTTNKGDLKKETIKIQTGKTLKVVSKGTLVEQKKETKPKETKPKETKPKETKPKETKPKETKPKPVKETKPKAVKKETKQKEPEIFKYNGEEYPIIIKPLTKKELKINNIASMLKIDSIEKFNNLNYIDKINIEFNVNDNYDILDEGARDLVNENYSGANYMSSNFDDDKFNRAVDKYTEKFYKIATKLRKKSKIEFLNFIVNDFSDITNYRFIF